LGLLGRACARVKMPAAVVVLVEELAALLGEHAGDALAVEIDEAGAGAVDAARQVHDTLSVERLHGRLDVRPRVLEVEPWLRRCRVARRRCLPPCLRHALQVRRDRCLFVEDVERADEHRRYAELIEAVEHQYAAAEAVRPDVERRPEGRERVLSAGPRACLFRSRRVRVVLAVVEHGLEEPRERPQVGRGRIEGPERCPVAVVDALDVEVREARRVRAPRLLLGPAVWDVGRVLGLVLKPGHVAAIVEGRFQEPAEGPPRLPGIREARRRRLAEDAGYVVLRRRPPVDLAGREAGAPFYARERALDARAVADDVVGAVVVFVRLPGRAVLHEGRHEDLRTGQHELIRLFAVDVLGEPLVGAPADRRKIDAPADAERTLALPRVVGERELGSAACARRGKGQRHRERPGPRHRVRAEGLADAADGAAPLRSRNGRQRNGPQGVGARRRAPARGYPCRPSVARRNTRGGSRSSLVSLLIVVAPHHPTARLRLARRASSGLAPSRSSPPLHARARTSAPPRATSLLPHVRPYSTAPCSGDQ
jgi:hypothetical protein